MKRIRLVLAIPYFVTSYGIVFWYTSGDYFCARPGLPNTHGAVSAKLAAACTAWYLFSSLCGFAAATASEKRGWTPKIEVVTSAVIAGAGFASMPFWIYRGYGRFLFEGTWADVSCVFTEGYGFAFPFFVAPLLTAAVLVCEWVTARAHRLH